MAADLVKIVNTVVGDLKQAYRENPKGVWSCPLVVISKRSGEINSLQGKSDEQMMQWMVEHLDLPKIDIIVVGRMVCKQGKIIDPATNAPIITEKAIMVMGRDMRTNRVRVSMTPCREHMDYRCIQSIETQSKAFDPSVKGADITKSIVNDITGERTATLTAKFEKETVMDTRDGHHFLMDPLMKGIVEVRNLDEGMQAAQDLNADTVVKQDPIDVLKGIK